MIILDVSTLAGEVGVLIELSASADINNVVCVVLNVKRLGN